MRKIGQILVDLGFIDDTQLEMLLEEQRESRSSELLGAIAQSLNLITDDQLAQALAEQWNLQVFSVMEVEIPKETLAYVSETYLRGFAPGAPPPPSVVEGPSQPVPAGHELIQLAAASSQAEADAHWQRVVRAKPELAKMSKTVTSAIVNGQQYYRLASLYGVRDFELSRRENLTGRNRSTDTPSRHTTHVAQKSSS